MSGKVIKGYWDCPHCGTKGIDGLVDICPGCGSGKDKNVRYYMKNTEAVSSEELEAAGISADENDGEHREWICAYCGALNNYRDQTCVHCGADKSEKEQDYGGDTSEIKYRKDKHGKVTMETPQEKPKEQTYETKEEAAARDAQNARAGRGGSPIRWVLIAAIALLAAFLFWPHTYSQAITGFEWQRNVTVEELRTFSESGWSVPAGARQTDSRMEFYGYQQVLDHYETVYETRTRQVLDHYDTSYTYTDNGNGTFSEHEVQTPVYTTETYTEPVQHAVYRNEPVYQRKYYYDLDRWVNLEDYPTSGKDHDPYWSNAYKLAANQRDTDRTESYYTIYNDEERIQTDYETWSRQNIGDGSYVTKCRLGITYSRREQ